MRKRMNEHVGLGFVLYRGRFEAKIGSGARGSCVFRNLNWGKTLTSAQFLKYNHSGFANDTNHEGYDNEDGKGEGECVVRGS